MLGLSEASRCSLLQTCHSRSYTSYSPASDGSAGLFPGPISWRLFTSILFSLRLSFIRVCYLVYGVQLTFCTHPVLSSRPLSAPTERNGDGDWRFNAFDAVYYVFQFLATPNAGQG